MRHARDWNNSVIHFKPSKIEGMIWIIAQRSEATSIIAAIKKGDKNARSTYQQSFHLS